MPPDPDIDRIRELYLRAQHAQDADELSYALSELVAAVLENLALQADSNQKNVVAGPAGSVITCLHD